MKNLIKTAAEIEIMAEAGRRLAQVLKALRKEVRVGMTTEELDKRTRELLKEVEAKAAFLGYQPHGADKPYPAVLCTSLNDVVVHGVPGKEVIRPGDIVKIDMGVVYKGYYSDAAFSVVMDPAPKGARALLAAAEEALRAGIKAAKPGNTLGDIGWAVSDKVNRAGFSVVQGLTGHGIGKALHEDPFVFNVGRKGEGEPLRPGMVIAIEPMVALGRGATKQLRDDSFATRDGSITAHFEHTVAILKDGPKVLTAGF